MKPLASVIAAVLMAGLCLAADDPKPTSRDGSNDVDEKAIRALLGDLEEKWNKHEMKGFSERLAEDADVVNRFGQWIRGRTEIEKHLVGLHASPYRDMLGSRKSTVEQVRFLTPDVALAHELTEERTGHSLRTYVLQKREGRWWIQSASITQKGQQPHP
jgi:uncharacterized protein (TIGR02246 family)